MTNEVVQTGADSSAKRLTLRDHSDKRGLGGLWGEGLELA